MKRRKASAEVQSAAHRAVRKAVIDGDLIRQPCEVCGATPVHGHHDDYNRPLAVRWLCSRHHIAHHRAAGDFVRKVLTPRQQQIRWSRKRAMKQLKTAPKPLYSIPAAAREPKPRMIAVTDPDTIAAIKACELRSPVGACHDGTWYAEAHSLAQWNRQPVEFHV